MSDISYDLIFSGGFRSLTPLDGLIQADLRASDLNIFGQSGTVRLHVPTRSAGIKGVPAFGISSFQLNSVETIIKRRTEIHSSVEVILLNERSRLPNEIDVSTNLWSDVKLLHIILEPKQVPTEEGIVRMKKWYPDETNEQILSRYDNVETQSRFTVILKVNWDKDHQRWAEFRDGTLVGITAE